MIQFTKIEHLEGVWRFVWPAGLGPVRVVLWGRKLAVTEDNEYTYSGTVYGTAGDPPPLEVVPNDGSLAVSEHNLCYLTLQWHRVDCRRYVVEGNDNGLWLERWMRWMTMQTSRCSPTSRRCSKIK